MKSLHSEMYRRAPHRRGLRKWPNEAGGIRIPTPEEFIFSTKVRVITEIIRLLYNP